MATTSRRIRTLELSQRFPISQFPVLRRHAGGRKLHVCRQERQANHSNELQAASKTAGPQINPSGCFLGSRPLHCTLACAFITLSSYRCSGRKCWTYRLRAPKSATNQVGCYLSLAACRWGKPNNVNWRRAVAPAFFFSLLILCGEWNRRLPLFFHRVQE